MSITLRPLSKQNTDFPKALQLYKEAFPSAQSIPMWLLRHTLRNGKPGFDLLYHNNAWIGLLYVLEYEDIIFVQSLAISASQRSKGFGSQILDTLKHQHKGKRIVLNIEVLDKNANNYQQRAQRKVFYERNQFRSSGYIVQEPKELLEMLILGDANIQKDEILTMYKHFFGGMLNFLLKPKVTEFASSPYA